MTIRQNLSSTNIGAKVAGLLFVGMLCLRSGGALFCAQEQEVTLDDIFGLMPQRIVTTASRHPQPVKESPSNVTVITAEEIRDSGATSVPQLLRSVAGLNVVQASASEWSVTSHQNTEFPGTGVLTLIDGRVVYMDIFSLVPWQALPLNMEDIARIEIVKSPSSALWGANAMDGIINIVTKTPAESGGTEIGVKGGDGGEQWHYASHAGQSGPWGYRVSGGYSSVPQFRNPIIGRDGSDPVSHMANGSAQAVYSVKPGKQLTLRAGASDGHGEILSSLGHNDRQGGLRYAQAEQLWGSWRLNAYYNGEDMRIAHVGPQSAITRSDIYVAELQNYFPWMEKHLLTWGVEGRYDRSHSPRIIGKDRDSTRGAVFLQEEYKPWNSLQLSAGGRFDYFSAIRDVPTARLGAVWTPRDAHTFRLSAGRSFGKPDIFRQYADTVLTYNLHEQNPALPPLPFNMAIKGNKNLTPARVDAVEFGYQNNSSSWLTPRLDVFFKEQRNGAIPVVTGYYPANALFPGSPGNLIPSAISEFDYRHNRTWGGEVSLDWIVQPGLVLFSNYSLQRESGLALGENGPLNRANAGARYYLRKLSVYGVMHYVDVRRFQTATQPALPKSPLTAPAYISVDARLGYRLTRQIEISISGSNIFNDVHREYADSDYIERRVLGGVTIEF